MTQENSKSDLADAVMCHCSGTTRGEVERLCRLGLDAEAISRKTGALSGCGGCEWDIEQFLNELGAQNPDDAH